MEAASFTTSLFPVVTFSILADHEKLERCYDPSEVNQSVFTLIKARKAINDARLAVLTAKRRQTKQPTIDRLTEIYETLTQAHNNFPLTILDNGGGHQRPSIMGGV